MNINEATAELWMAGATDALNPEGRPVPPAPVEAPVQNDPSQGLIVVGGNPGKVSSLADAGLSHRPLPPSPEVQALLDEKAGYEARLAPVLAEVARLTSTTVDAGLTLDEELAQRKGAAARLAELAIEQKAIKARLKSVTEALAEVRKAEREELQERVRVTGGKLFGDAMTQIEGAVAELEKAAYLLTQTSALMKGHGLRLAFDMDAMARYDAEAKKLVAVFAAFENAARG